MKLLMSPMAPRRILMGMTALPRVSDSSPVGSQAEAGLDALGSGDLLDEAYERFHSTSPEFRGWLSNHGPMAVDALLRLGAQNDVHDWIGGYAGRLEPTPSPRWPISEREWREPLGDPSRVGDWLIFFSGELAEEPWQQVLQRWWPRLLPGAVAAATHGLIRTGHAVRALRVAVTPPRTTELAQALGYWAARWQPISGPRPPRGTLTASQALAAVPSFHVTGGVRTRLAAIEESECWDPVVRGLADRETEDIIPHALTMLIDAAVSAYSTCAHGNPVMLVHAATAPRAAALVLPSIPRDLWRPTYTTAWTLAAAITAAYRPLDPPSTDAALPNDITTGLTPDGAVADAVRHRDEHVLKFTEVALESWRRGNQTALSAVRRAVALLPTN